MPHALAAMSSLAGKRENQEQHADRIDEDAERVAARGVGGPDDRAPPGPRQDHGVEQQRRQGAERSLPPREHAQQQREHAHRDVHDLAGRLREHGQAAAGAAEIASTTRATPSSRGVTR